MNNYEEKKKTKIDLSDYITVNERIEKFYQKYPDGSIQTEIFELTDTRVIMRSFVYRTPDDIRPATGMAMEVEGSSFINRNSHIENAETSAVGRALAMLGFEIKKSIASKEEVENAKLNQNKENISEKISQDQLKRLYSIINSDSEKLEIVKEACKKYGYDSSKNIDKKRYNDIIDLISK